MEKFLKTAAVLLIVICLILSSSATPARADSEGAGTVTASALNMRSEASTSGAIVTCLPRGSVVVINDTLDGWYKVSYKDFSGYMSSEYLDVTNSADAALGTGTIRGTGVRVRSGPGLDETILGNENSGKTLEVTGVSGEWYKVSYNGSNGYVNSSYMDLGGSSSGSSVSAPEETPLSGTGTINADYVRLRSGPSTSHSILDVFSAGDTMSVTGQAGDWYKVSCGGTEGYVYKPYLNVGGSSSGGSSSTSVTDMSDTAATVISAVHMRSGPDTSYTSQRVLEAGTGVTITGATEKWYRVTYNGSEGYIFKTYLTTGSVSSSSSEGQRIVDEARKYLGVGYVYGGSSPSGFDCSGFVYYVYRQCGYSVTRTATTQSYDGRQVSRSELQPGDIIIFYNSAKSAIGHSAIYIGNGQFIHASSAGGRVMITDLSTSYYDARVYTVRRVVG